ncbi:hydantoinase/oxoprolinase family protein [Falsigemmobacter faecalis]|uniref:Hydantoinase/oxoprolinase family protein n=1 Tax=Falsigemmobacter faecalis TaxID=2488730 RepID=A0A3P3DQC1_9RHOB|nr:hydantoinase/oxoprolinase family protein [Falsigemmobacter faecalis]RRH76351.1 hydantoinase/oxoprolinase family protein [Falsigemmobacter faecalis]
MAEASGQLPDGRGVRVGIDVGGTFTDFVLHDPAAGRLVFFKEPSTPDEPSRALLQGLSTLLTREGIAFDQVGALMHGTTIGLNAIIQRKGAKIGLIVSRGFRDILEIARCRMPSSFDLHADKETPLVPRDRVVELNARLNSDGSLAAAPDAAEIAALGEALRAMDLDAAALVTLNGYLDPAFEEDLAAQIAEASGLEISAAAVIWPEIREYERALVACLNAYIQPLMHRYFDGLIAGLSQMGVSAPVLVTASNGGSLSVASARARPVETVLSGPASGVMAAVRLAEAARATGDLTGQGIVTFDMGGTSSDIAIAGGATPELATRTDIGGLPLVLPVVDVSAIGAGGGSVVWVDPHGLLKVGPQSAGAAPGPVCYGRGGTAPAVTDCYLTLGYIDPAGFLGGRMQLDAPAAEAALAQIGGKLGYEGSPRDIAARTAEGALAVTTAGMASALYKTLAERGLDPRGFALMPFGGAGPTHASRLAEETGIRHVIVPPAAGTFCAQGAAGADLRRDFVRSFRLDVTPDLTAALSAAFAALEGEAALWLDAENGTTRPRRFERAADMRYHGQAYELRVRLEGDLSAGAARAAFEAEHKRIYGFADPQGRIAIGTIRLAAIGPADPLLPPKLTSGGEAAPKGHRPLWLKDRWHEAAVWRRAALAPGLSLSGPAVIEQDDTTTILLPGWSARVDEAGNLHLERLTDAA